MGIEQLSGVAEILGTAATIAGLLFLSIQVRDNTKVTKTSALASMLEDARDRTAGQLCFSAVSNRLGTGPSRSFLCLPNMTYVLHYPSYSSDF